MAEMEEAFTSVSDGIGELVLNRPERKNALSPGLVAAMSTGAACAVLGRLLRHCSGFFLSLAAFLFFLSLAAPCRAGRADRGREGRRDPHPR